MVTETFGDMLYYPDSEHHEEFPSPESLKKRIILSTKPPKEYLEATISKDKENGSKSRRDSNEEEAWGGEVPDLKAEIESDDKVWSYKVLWCIFFNCYCYPPLIINRPSKTFTDVYRMIRVKMRMMLLTTTSNCAKIQHPSINTWSLSGLESPRVH